MRGLPVEAGPDAALANRLGRGGGLSAPDMDGLATGLLSRWLRAAGLRLS